MDNTSLLLSGFTNREDPTLPGPISHQERVSLSLGSWHLPVDERGQTASVGAGTRSDPKRGKKKWPGPEGSTKLLRSL